MHSSDISLHQDSKTAFKSLLTPRGSARNSLDTTAIAPHKSPSAVPCLSDNCNPLGTPPVRRMSAAQKRVVFSRLKGNPLIDQAQRSYSEGANINRLIVTQSSLSTFRGAERKQQFLLDNDPVSRNQNSTNRDEGQ